MVAKHKKSNSKDTTFRSCGLGTVIAIGISVLIASIVALMTINGAIKEDSAKLTAPLIQLVAAMIGAFISGKLAGEKKVIACIIAAAAYYAALIGATIVFFEGEFYGLFIGAVAVTAGCFIAVLCNVKKRKRKIYRR